MLNILFQSPIAFIVTALGLLLALTIHEFAHAISADHLGDPTPRQQGRISVNPLAHLDPLGTVMLLIFGFGWGKPVQFDPYNLRSPRRDSAIISLAGPISNILLAVFVSLMAKFILPSYLLPLVHPLIYINIVLAVFNLVPIYPLDGEKILSGILPHNLAIEYAAVMKRYGTIILLLMIFPFFGHSPIFNLISPIIGFITNLLV